jgi:signal transduction histidine kinase
VAVAYVVGARIGLAFDPASGVATAVWPPSGIALAALLLGGLSLWPAVALGAFVANLSIGVPVAAALGFAGGNTLAAVVAAQLVERFAAGRRALDNVPGTLAFVSFAGLFSTAIAATVGVTSGRLGGVVTPEAAAFTWRSWWVGDMLGVLLVAPPLLVLRWRAPRWSSRRWIEAGLVAALVVAVGLYVFGRPGTAGALSLYFVFPVLLVATLRFGRAGAVLSNLAVATVAVAATAAGLGPLAGGPLGERLIELQQFTGIAAVTMLVLGAALAELAAERGRLARRVGRRTRQVRALGRALTLAEQQERTRLSQVLHDDLQQVLFGQLMRLGLVRESLADSAADDVARELAETDRLVRHAIEITRTTVAHMRPAELSADGLAEGLRMLAASMEAEYRLRVEVVVEADEMEVGADVQILVLKMVRELLFNVVKHADTDHARVTMTGDAATIRLTVSDDGRGFEPSVPANARSFGLRSIRERLDLVGGRIDIDARPSAGTRVSLSVPLYEGRAPEPAG